MPNNPRPYPNAQLFLTPAGEVYTRIEQSFFSFSGVDVNLLRQLMEFLDGNHSWEDILKGMAQKCPLNYLKEIIAALERIGFFLESDPNGLTYSCGLLPDPNLARFSQEKSLALVGNYRLLDELNRVFQGMEWQKCRAFFPESFASCQQAEFLTQKREKIIADGSALMLPQLKPQVNYECLKSVTVVQLSQLFQEVDLVICALEGVPFRALLDINQAALNSGTPCLFLSASPQLALIGPTVIRGLTPCFGCRLLALEGIPQNCQTVAPFLCAPILTSTTPQLISSIVQAVLEVTTSLFSPNALPLYTNQVLKLTSQGEHSKNYLIAGGECHECASPQANPSSVLEKKATVAAAVELSRIWPLSPLSPRERKEDGYRTVGILGGGTAGYMTALAFRAFHPDIEVTLIESSRIPVIGVGEATTPELVRFLHSSRFLGKDLVDFWKRVRPTWKLGIRFKWGLPGEHEFTFPFQRGRLLESCLYESSLNRQSLGAILMMGELAPVFAPGDGEILSLLHLIRWAYHLDNRRLIAYLKEEATASGVKLIDTEIQDAALSVDGENIAHLIAEDGRQLEYDLYVDCSGFRSFLLEQKLRSKFISYQDTLFTDSALTFTVPNQGRIKSYTQAETMNNGWCWTIPFEDIDHCGYVFSSPFCTQEQALEELRTKYPQFQESWRVKFRSGRHEHFWKGNVVALGNSYAFVEPLESTALHMLVLELELLMTNLPASRGDEKVKEVLNRKINARWDALRWFLGIHYKFNRRSSTPFWQMAREKTDISGAQERVALFQERAPLSYRNSLFYTVYPPEFFSDDHSYDTILLGQQLPCQLLPPVEALPTWQRHLAILLRMSATALRTEQALICLREERPDLLRGFVEHSESWLHHSIPA